MRKNILFLVSMLSLSTTMLAQQYGILKDTRDGKIYKTVKIGNQVWMADNLDVSKFRNGDLILHAKTSKEWEKAGKNKQPAWCYFEYDSNNLIFVESISKNIGKLYNWYAVNDPRGIAPLGWHVPTEKEWESLTNFLGKNAGTKLKNTFGWMSLKGDENSDKDCLTCIDWSESVKNKVTCKTCKGTRRKTSSKLLTDLDQLTNRSGFSAIPGGHRSNDGFFFPFQTAHYWGSTLMKGNSNFATSFMIYINNHNLTQISHRADMKADGLYMRCIKD